MAGKKGRSGRKKLPEREVKEAIEALRDDVPLLFEKLKIVALGLPIECPECKHEIPGARPDKDSLIYLIDRVLGRPKQELTATMKAAVVIMTPDDYERAIRQAHDVENSILTGISTNTLELTAGNETSNDTHNV
jgi:hypothetical protein